MKTNNEINKYFAEPLSEAIGQTITRIEPQDNLGFWEIELGDGSILAVDRFNGDGETRIGISHVKPNVQAQPLAPAGDNLTPSGEIQESAKNLPAPGAGDGCAAATCSASSLDKYKPQKVSLVIGNELITITVDQTQEYKDKIIRADEYTKMIEAINSEKNQNWYSCSKKTQ